LTAQVVDWVSKSRSAVKREVRSLLTKVDNAEADVFIITARQDASWQKITALQESRNALLEAIRGYMVPSADLHEALDERNALLAEVERLAVLEAIQAKEIDVLSGSLLVAQNEADRHLTAMQVGQSKLNEIRVFGGDSEVMSTISLLRKWFPALRLQS
jgi:hypothetical protein